jgi:glycerophosphoryl diester phosphodiesterase
MKYCYILIASLLFIGCGETKTNEFNEVRKEVKSQKFNSPEEILAWMKNPTNDYVLTCAHRGFWRSAPENSLLAVKNAVDLGVDIIEIDVRKTKDNQLIVIHDKTIDRTTTGKGRIENLTYDSIQKVNLKTGAGIKTHYKVPTLEEIMLSVKGKPVIINLDKAWSCLPETYAVLKKTGTINQGLFKGNDPVELLRKKAGNLLDSIVYMPMVWPMEYSIYERDSIVSPKDYVKHFIDDYQPVAFETLFNKENSPVLESIKVMQENKTSVLVVTLWDELCAGHSDERAYENPEKHWGWLIEKGANIIMTDRPASLLNYLKSKSLHH